MNDIVHDILETTVGNIFGKDITCREPVHRCDDYQPGTLVEFGRTGVKVCVDNSLFDYTRFFRFTSTCMQ